jgi:hypothetical protein
MSWRIWKNTPSNTRASDHSNAFSSTCIPPWLSWFLLAPCLWNLPPVHPSVSGSEMLMHRDRNCNFQLRKSTMSRQTKTITSPKPFQCVDWISEWKIGMRTIRRSSRSTWAPLAMGACTSPSPRPISQQSLRRRHLLVPVVVKNRYALYLCPVHMSKHWIWQRKFFVRKCQNDFWHFFT